MLRKQELVKSKSVESELTPPIELKKKIGSPPWLTDDVRAKAREIAKRQGIESPSAIDLSKLYRVAYQTLNEKPPPVKNVVKSECTKHKSKQECTDGKCLWKEASTGHRLNKETGKMIEYKIREHCVAPTHKKGALTSEQHNKLLEKYGKPKTKVPRTVVDDDDIEEEEEEEDL